MSQLEIMEMTPGQFLDQMQAISGRFLEKVRTAKAEMTAELVALNEQPEFKALEAKPQVFAGAIVLQTLTCMMAAPSEL